MHIECGDLVAWFMPRQSEWLLRLPAIRSELEALSVPVVDRSIFEKVFGVRRRRAIQLMHRFGGFQSGKTFWIERSSLLRQLESLEASGEVSSDLRRRERLSSQLDQVRQYARAARVPIAAPPEVYATRLTSLPSGVRLDPGRLTVEFASPEQLLERLFALSQALVNDLDSWNQYGLQYVRS